LFRGHGWKIDMLGQGGETEDELKFILLVLLLEIIMLK